MKVVKSYGIIAYKNDSIILIRKRVTYAFIDFANGRYNISNIGTLIELFNNMTFQEKTIILTFNFKIIWYNCNLVLHNNKHYKKAKYKFDLLLRSNIANTLKDIIYKSYNKELLWEIPKGRQRKTENTINTSIREFYEETNIKNDHYQFLFNVEPIIYSFIDDGINYIYYYYSAIIINNNYNPQLNFTSSDMVFEISNIKFIPLKDLNFYLNSHDLIKKIKNNYKLIKRKLNILS